MSARALALALAVALPAAAQQEPPAPRLALTVGADVAIASGGFVLFGVTELLKPQLAPGECRVCGGTPTTGLPGDPAAAQRSVNGADAWFHDALTGSLLSRKGADTFSNVWAFGAVPLGALAASWFATGREPGEWAGARAALVVAESAGVAVALTQALKFSAARTRPFARYGHGTDGPTADEGGTFDANNPDSRLSFPSGHTASTAALAFGAAMTAQLQESKAAPALWAGAAAVTVITAASRMIAEKHWFTDVLTGAAIGAGCGVLVPLLHRPGAALGSDRAAGAAAPRVAELSLGAAPLQGGSALVFAGRF